MVQLRTVNKAIAHTGLELVRGEGYFYFVGDGTEFLETSSVYVPRLNDLSLGRWVTEAEYIADQISKLEPFTPATTLRIVLRRK